MGVRTVESPLMMSLRPRSLLTSGLLGPGVLLAGCCVFSLVASAQQEKHGRGYKAPPPTATVQVTVEKAANEKPLANASVIFRAVQNDDVTANLEMKTDPDGRASMDLLEVGSHVTVQVIAGGYATYASGFELTADGKQILVKLQRPRAQVSAYGESVDRPAESHPGVQERPRAANGASSPAKTAPAAGSVPAPTSIAPGAPSNTAPLNTTPPVPTPGTAPGSSTAPSLPGTPGSPQ